MILKLLTAVAVVGLASQALAQADKPFLDVGKQPQITILINSSPWYAGFEKTVALYERQTGNKVKLDPTPYLGTLEKGRNAVRGSESPYDIINIDTSWNVEFYEGGFLTPLSEIERGYDLPPEVLRCGDSYYWNQTKRWRTSKGGALMAIPPNCNVHVLVYRADLFDGAKLKAPDSYDELRATCQKLQNRPSLYGFVTRGERGNGIRFDWTPFMLAHGAEVVRDPENGDYTVTINSPKAKKALDAYVDVMTNCGPANAGSIGQADMIQLMATGKVVMAQTVIAAWSNFEDPTKSAVVGKVHAAPPPRSADGHRGVVVGNWHFAIPKNLPDPRKRAGLAFMKWFLTKDAQRAYAENGAIPVRTDVLTSELAEKPQFRWMKGYNEAMKFGQQVLGYAEGAEVEQVIGLRLNQALIGQLSTAKALNEAAKEVHAIFQRTGRKTGMLGSLPE